MAKGKSSGVRLSGGEFRGRQLTVPKQARPTEGRVREALFSIWSDRLADCRFLDLFAGSGAVGLEALGRGALEVIAVESDRQAVEVLKKNASNLQARGFLLRVGVLPKWLEEQVSGEARTSSQLFDLIFADPPYRFTQYTELLIAVSGLLARDGALAIEHSSRTSLPDEAGLLLRTEKRSYGESTLSFYSHQPR